LYSWIACSIERLIDDRLAWRELAERALPHVGVGGHDKGLGEAQHEQRGALHGILRGRRIGRTGWMTLVPGVAWRCASIAAM
jgi:hypothetical protein